MEKVVIPLEYVQFMFNGALATDEVVLIVGVVVGVVAADDVEA